MSQDKTPKKRRQLGRRKTEEAVERLLKEKFGDIPTLWRETKRVNGELLRDRLLREKRARTGQRISHVIIQAIHDEYTTGDTGLWSLHPPTAGEKIADALVAGLQQASLSNPAKRATDMLESYIRNCPIMNQTEVYGMCKAIVANNVLGQPKKDAVLLEIMHYFNRTRQLDLWIELKEASRYFETYSV